MANLINNTSYAGLQAAVTIAVSWLSWYIWKFVLKPKLYPNEPRELQYLIPIVGHTLSMVTGAHRLFINGSKRFRNKPWTLTIMGESIYVIPSAEDIQAVYRLPRALDFDPVIKEILSKYGITGNTLLKMFDLSPGQKKTFMETTVENFKLQMHPGEKLDLAQERLLGLLDDLLDWEGVRGRMILKDGKRERLVSLYTWCHMVIVDAQTRTFFDEVIYDQCPDLLFHFQNFEQESWKLPMDLPDLATRALRFSKTSIEGALESYLRLPNDKRPNESWIISTLCEDLDKLCLDATQKAHILFSFYRVINANAYKLVFWIISHLLFSPDLLQEVRAEIAPAFPSSNPSAPPDLDYLFNHCPLLTSTCEEVLRLTDWPVGPRKVQTDTVIGGMTLRAGKTLLMPYRTMHFDPTVFGPDSASFNPRRFMENKTLITSKSYRPFGGGKHICPGRYIARREVQMCTAVMLMRFDMEVAEEESKGAKLKFPRMDDTLPSGGIQAPLKGEDLGVRVRPRYLA